MADDSNDAWAALPVEEALRRVQYSIGHRWQAWTVPTSDEGIVWCARRLGDGALAHGDTPARLLHHVADADETLLSGERGWP